MFEEESVRCFKQGQKENETRNGKNDESRDGGRTHSSTSETYARLLHSESARAGTEAARALDALSKHSLYILLSQITTGTKTCCASVIHNLSRVSQENP